MKPAAFAYHSPGSVEEVLHLLGQHGEDARILAGGQSLVAMMNMRLVTPEILIDINEVGGLSDIDISRDTVRIGATVRQFSALEHDGLGRAATLLPRALHYVGHFQTRNRGTLCGSVAHADPSAETPLALLVMGGEVELKSSRGRRRVAADRFFRSALTTDRRGDELVTAISVPVQPARSGSAFSEFALREGDFAIVAAACALSLAADGTIQRFALGFGGVADRPILCPAGQVVGNTLVDCRKDVRSLVSALIADLPAPPTDLHATSTFRRQLIGVLATEVVARAFDEAASALEDHA